MFYNLISKKRDEWFSRSDCPMKSFVAYIQKKGFMRDAQIDAIKTYLYLKIDCKNKPFYDLFVEGKFNTLTEKQIDELPLAQSVRTYFKAHPETVSLYEYATTKDSNGKEISPALAERIKTVPQNIDYLDFYKKIFYGVQYTDYLFSLPMGAGKTFLMAAFIYIDLYFALNEPENPAFAHNFIILAPSGTKTSIIPSLRTIQYFNPANVIPEPAASNLKRWLIFEVLDENKSASKSNRTKNPNVQKIAIHQPLEALFGLVVVTNAEKVILENAVVEGGLLFERTEDEKSRASNELRHLIGKIPNLSVFIDEVHHAESGEIKLRAVVNNWAYKSKNINSVLGFSGTPYLEKAEKINLADDLSVKSSEISSIVFYYPLAHAIGNFLKIPIVNIRTCPSEEIVREAVGEFLRQYGGKTYANGTCPKIGIYCGTIENLEENIYPEVEAVSKKFCHSPEEIILKNHDGNKKHPVPKNAKADFDALDSPISKKRIVLLVNIGKEGWDCKSLAAVILTQKSECPKNMVLQTSCRCLREVADAKTETASIYLNSQNAEILREQLEKQHKMNLEEFQKSVHAEAKTLNRYDRTEFLNLPAIDLIQLKVSYSKEIVEEATEEKIRSGILASAENAKIENPILQTAVITKNGLEIVNQKIDESANGLEAANFDIWKYNIVRESFGTMSMADLKPYENELWAVFEGITTIENIKSIKESSEKSAKINSLRFSTSFMVDEEKRFFNPHYDLKKINSKIRVAFFDKRRIITNEEKIPETAKLLRIKDESKFSPFQTFRPEKYFPPQLIVENIIKEDSGETLLDEKTLAAIESLKSIGQNEMAQQLLAQKSSFPQKDKTLHYLPFYADSDFEPSFLNQVLTFDVIKQKNLEVYYNGDNNFTDFQIKCHKKNENGAWVYIGNYTPDFLILHRDDKNKIDKVLIVETKGELYSHDPKFIAKRDFVENTFIKDLNPNMDYLYIEDTMSENQILAAVNGKITEFFE